MNETLSIRWFLRDDTPCLPPPWPLRMERLVWEEPGGAALAVLSAQLDSAAAADAAAWAADALRRPLVVDSPEGEACWNGFVARAEIHLGRAGAVFDLAQLANRVAAVYTPPVNEPPFTARPTRTDWAEDPLSLNRFGRKERLLQLGPEAPSRALSARDAYLQRHALPQAEPFLLARRAAPSLRLICRGWFSTLDWSYLWIEQGREGFLEPAQTPQTLGRLATSDALLAQSFQTDYGPFYLLEAGLNLKRNATPADGVVVEVCADQNGTPGAVLAGSSLPADALPGGRGWARFRFAEPPLLQAGLTYWLRFSRSGALNSSHYYVLYREGNNPYPAGRMMNWNGSAWADGSGGLNDLNFYILAGQSRRTRLLELTAPQSGGQFLKGVHLPADLPGVTAYPSDGLRPCGAELLDLLGSPDAAGRPLSVQVNAERELIVQALPAEDEARWLLQPDGRLTTPAGRPARLGERLAGEWARLSTGGGVRPLLLRRVVWTPQDGLRAVPAGNRRAG